MSPVILAVEGDCVHRQNNQRHAERNRYEEVDDVRCPVFQFCFFHLVVGVFRLTIPLVRNKISLRRLQKKIGILQNPEK